MFALYCKAVICACEVRVLFVHIYEILTRNTAFLNVNITNQCLFFYLFYIKVTIKLYYSFYYEKLLFILFSYLLETYQIVNLNIHVFNI